MKVRRPLEGRTSRQRGAVLVVRSELGGGGGGVVIRWLG